MKMPTGEHFARVNLMEIKHQIECKVGLPKAKKYFDNLLRFVDHKIGPIELSKLARDVLGRGNVHLHNHLLRSMLKNANCSTSPPKASKVEASKIVRVPNGYHKSGLQSMCKDFPKSPRKGRTPNRTWACPSPLGPHGKAHDVVSKVQEQQSATELLSLGGRPPGSEEDGEEVEQAAGSPGVYSRSPVRAPLGIPMNMKAILKRKFFDTCHSYGELPGTSLLKKRLESKLEMEGLNVSVDCVNLLNNSVDVFLKRLIKPCLELARSRSTHTDTDSVQYRNIPGLNGMWPVRNAKRPRTPVSASMLDFRVAVELNPMILGEDWPTQLEKICLRGSEDRTE